MHKHHYREEKKSFLFGIIVNGVFTIIELVAGLLSNSLALLSDALHDFTDTVALILAYVTTHHANRKPSEQKTFGYQRATILAAFLNGTFLLLIAGFLLYKAYGRLLQPEPVASLWLIGVSIFGLIANGLIVLRVHKHKHDINAQAVWWHMMEDFLGWIGVLIGGIVMYFTGWYIIDPIISILLSLFVLYGGYKILSETINVLLEGVPRDIVLADVEQCILNFKGVTNVHDLHVWQLGSKERLLTCHVVTSLKTVRQASALKQHIKEKLHKQFHIGHATIECECTHCNDSC